MPLVVLEVPSSISTDLIININNSTAQLYTEQIEIKTVDIASLILIGV